MGVGGATWVGVGGATLGVGGASWVGVRVPRGWCGGVPHGWGGGGGPTTQIIKSSNVFVEV